MSGYGQQLQMLPLISDKILQKICTLSMMGNRFVTLAKDGNTHNDSWLARQPPDESS
jgi:hypothetical protein